MRALILILGLAACAPLPPTAITPTEATGLAMLHQLRAADPCTHDLICSGVRHGRN
ncbi:MAG: hypothetical protein JNN06_03265 [Gemmobacter sp.]|uniref:hypothetical protein n=1 Tax=Gemmobacter sp. TaxID=1898957 RepID=UPI001A5B442B|nr:hypothetical protein [Gemmobacter sp.]MBL8561278.1 hypothetical protein [Gemmobacter sp.]